MTTLCKKFRVTGRVQGVWFRASTQDQAKRLGLTGYAKNLADGSVEVIACGEEANLQSLQAWLYQGPPAAEVNAVETINIEPQTFSSFSVQ